MNENPMRCGSVTYRTVPLSPFLTDPSIKLILPRPPSDYISFLDRPLKPTNDAVSPLFTGFLPPPPPLLVSLRKYQFIFIYKPHFRSFRLRHYLFSTLSIFLELQLTSFGAASFSFIFPALFLCDHPRTRLVFASLDFTPIGSINFSGRFGLLCLDAAPTFVLFMTLFL